MNYGAKMGVDKSVSGKNPSQTESRCGARRRNREGQSDAKFGIFLCRRVFLGSSNSRDSAIRKEAKRAWTVIRAELETSQQSS